MSESGDGRSWLITRIISSGVMPLATMPGDEGAGAGADVDVELVDRAVDGQQVERAQRADLVHAAGEPTAAQHERGLGTALGDLFGSEHPRDSVRGVSSSTTFPMAAGHYAGSAVRSGPPRRRRLPGDRLGRGRRPAGSRRPRRPTRRSPARTCEQGLAKQMRHVGGAERRLRHRPRRRAATGRCSAGHRTRRRTLASNTKLFTMAALLDRFGAQATFKTRVYARVRPRAGRAAHARRERGGGRGRRPGARQADPSLAATACPLTPLGRLAGEIRRAGIKRITRQGAARTTRSSTAVAAFRPAAWTPRASSGRSPASPTTRASSTATTRGIRSSSPPGR